MRVLQEGEVGAGDLIEMIEKDPQRITVEEMNRLLYFDPKNVEDAKRALCIDALSPGWRGSFEERLERAGISVEFIETPEDGPCCGPCQNSKLWLEGSLPGTEEDAWHRGRQLIMR